MGKIRTKTVKRAAKQLVELYYNYLGQDFYLNKRIIRDTTSTESKKLKNKIAGYATHIMKRLTKGSVRGISLKVQQEEHERRMERVPDESAFDQRMKYGITIDKNTMEMLRHMKVGVPSRVREQKAVKSRAKQQVKPRTA